MLSEVQKAIERGELRLHYQPIVSLKSGEITGFEGLVRWVHPERGLLLPASFMPPTEELDDELLPLTMWAIKEACEQGRHLQRAGYAQTPVISVNVDDTLLRSQARVEDFIDVILDAGVAPHNIAVEISERELMPNVACLAPNLEFLHNSGILLYLDNFGTGSCSIPALADLPICTIKVDRSFVAGLEAGRKGEQVLAALLAVGRSLERRLVAVGVENAEEVHFLKEASCAYAQGDYFASALDVGAALWLKRVGATRSGGEQIDSVRLRFFGIFRDLADEQVDYIARRCGERTFSSGATIIRQGQVGNEMYLLEEGVIEVYLEYHDSIRHVAQLGAPTVFGEMAVVHPERIRTANVRAVTDVRVVSIPLEALLSSFRSWPVIKEKLREMVAERLAR